MSMQFSVFTDFQQSVVKLWVLYLHDLQVQISHSYLALEIKFLIGS
jgi:hypothetical protein